MALIPFLGLQRREPTSSTGSTFGRTDESKMPKVVFSSKLVPRGDAGRFPVARLR